MRVTDRIAFPSGSYLTKARIRSSATVASEHIELGADRSGRALSAEASGRLVIKFQGAGRDGEDHYTVAETVPV